MVVSVSIFLPPCSVIVQDFCVSLMLAQRAPDKAPTSTDTPFYLNVSEVTRWFAVFSASRGQPDVCIAQVSPFFCFRFDARLFNNYDVAPVYSANRFDDSHQAVLV